MRRLVATGVCSRTGFLVLLAVFVVATSPAITLGADDPVQTDEDQPDDEKEGFWSRFKDEEDGKFDIMASGDKQAGIFPIAIPFNEPAVGAGLVLALGYFHPKKETPSSSPERKGAPPTTSFVAGAGTTNGTWFAAGGHSHTFKNDTIRYLGAIGGGSINLTFYGFGDGGTSDEGGVDFNTKVAALVQQGKFRIGNSPVFVGGRYVYASTDTKFDGDTERALDGDSDLAGLTGLVEYDTRDTVFTPNKGLHTGLDLAWFAEALGGDFDYGSAKFKIRYYWGLGGKWVLGFRGDLDAIGDDAPFYALSFVTLRGVPVFRYLGNYVATVEIEPRYKIDERWSVVAFTGAGRAAKELSNLSDADKVYSFGAGFRYMLARKLGLGVGFDVARGPEDTVVYLTVGSAW